MSPPPSRRFVFVFARLLVVLVALGATGAGAEAQGRERRAAERTAMGRALIGAGNPGSAAAYLREAIQIDPRHEAAYVALGGLYHDAGRDSDALEVIRAGLRRRPGSVPLAVLLARVLEPSNPDEASAILRQATRREPDSLVAHRARAGLAQRRGFFAEALASYRAIHRLTEGAADQEELHTEAARYVAALRLLVRDVDPVSRCEPTEVRRALCD